MIGVISPASRDRVEGLADVSPRRTRGESRKSAKQRSNSFCAAQPSAPDQVRSFQFVPHGQETDANRDFAPDRASDRIVWFLIAIPLFMVIHAICVKMGAI